MSMSEKFSLKWNDFHSNVSSSFSALRNEDYLQDVTLVTDDDHHVSAHKLVLSACSDYFKNIFKKSKHANPLLCLDGITSNDIANVLNCVYIGKVHIYQENLDHFLKIAQKLRLQGLLSSEEPSELKDEPSKENVNEEILMEPRDTTQRQTLVTRTLSTASHVESIGKISIPEDEEIEKLDERINEQIEKDQDGNYRCRMCGKSSNKISNIKNHTETHFKGLSYPCSICPVKTSTRHALKKHYSRSHGGCTKQIL